MPGACWTLTPAIAWAVRGMWDKQTTRIDTPTMKQAKARLRETGLTKTDQGTWTVSKKGLWTVGAGGVYDATAANASGSNSSILFNGTTYRALYELPPPPPPIGADKLFEQIQANDTQEKFSELENKITKL